MKFCFINASSYDDLIGDKIKKNCVSTSWPPLGILYLASMLEKIGIDVSVLDQQAKGFTVEEVVNWVRREDPDILGFSTSLLSGRSAAVISNEVKERNPNLVVVFGGYYATFNADRILRKYPSVDIIVKGEGENTVVDLVITLERGSRLRDVLGITYRDGNDIFSTRDRQLIKDLNSLPFPDRTLLDVEYHSTIAGANLATKKFTTILSSRGCSHRCRFCSAQKLACNIWRPRSIQNTIEELCYLASEGYEQFVFVDDNLTLNQKRVIKLCKSIREEKLDMEWFCEGRVDNTSYQSMREMSQAGCKVIFFGIESANQRILNYYNKQITPSQSQRAVTTARKAGIDIIVGSFLLGAPNETRLEIQKTLEFAKQLTIDFPQFAILGAFPGTDIWNELTLRGFLKEEEYWETGIAVPKICKNAVPIQDIQRMISNALYDFFKRPSFILRQIARLLRSPYRMKLLIDNFERLGIIKEEIVGSQWLD